MNGDRFIGTLRSITSVLIMALPTSINRAESLVFATYNHLMNDLLSSWTLHFPYI